MKIVQAISYFSHTFSTFCSGLISFIIFFVLVKPYFEVYQDNIAKHRI